MQKLTTFDLVIRSKGTRVVERASFSIRKDFPSHPSDARCKEPIVEDVICRHQYAGVKWKCALTTSSTALPS